MAEADTTQPSRTGLDQDFEPWMEYYGDNEELMYFRSSLGVN